MRIALISSEAVPFSKTGGLADVAGTLFREYNRMGVDASLFVPLYKVTAERFRGSLVDTGTEIDIPVGKIAKKCRVFTAANQKRGNQGHGTVYFVSNDEYFGRDEMYCDATGDYPDNDSRFIFFCKSVLEICRKFNLKFDVLHCNDWQTGLIPLYLMTLYRSGPLFKKTRTVLTIHNLGFQGLFPASALEITGLGTDIFNPEGIEFYGKVNFLKAGIISADIITTVSSTYAKEILTPEKGFGLDGVLRKRAASLFGVLNGIDYTEWNPAGDDFLPAAYSKIDLSGKAKCKKELMVQCAFKGSQETPLLCFVGRLSAQKGIDLLTGTVDELMKGGANLFVLGKGDRRFEEALKKYGHRYPGRVYIGTGFDEALAHLAYAGSDIFLMPSVYEPCGLGQMIAMRYGTIPVAYDTGGLADTIVSPGDHAEKFFCEKVYGTIKETGFLFGRHSREAFLGEIRKALCIYYNKDIWQKLIKNAMGRDFSWKKSAARYLELYNTSHN
jgi:starch synthase